MLACFPENLEPWRKFSATWCAAHVNTRKSALYWVSHTKKRLEVFLRADDTPEIFDAIQNELPSDVVLIRRPHPRKGIAIVTPLYFFVETEEQVGSMGPLLALLLSDQFNRKASARQSAGLYWVPNSEKNDPEHQSKEEGNKVTVTISKYERNRKNREKCIQHYGAICKVCGFDFSKFYGEIGQGYIHVHHLISLAAQKGKARRIDPVKDLRPVCPNCHEMLHTEDPPLTIEHLRALIADAKGEAR